MKRIEVRIRNVSKNLEVGQLYGDINDENDITVNGSITVTGTDFVKDEKVRIYVNLCNEKGEIMRVISSHPAFCLSEGGYYVFSAYCASLNRFFDVSDFAYAEIFEYYIPSEEQNL